MTYVKSLEAVKQDIVGLQIALTQLLLDDPMAGQDMTAMQLELQLAKARSRERRLLDLQAFSHLLVTDLEAN